MAAEERRKHKEQMKILKQQVSSWPVVCACDTSDQSLPLCFCPDAAHSFSFLSFTGEVQENPAGAFGEGTPCSADFGGTCMYNLNAYTLYRENNINIIQLYNCLSAAIVWLKRNSTRFVIGFDNGTFFWSVGSFGGAYKWINKCIHQKIYIHITLLNLKYSRIKYLIIVQL